MVEISPIPRAELQRISRANQDVVEVAEELLELYGKATDQRQRQKLQEAIARLISDTNVISAAVQSTAYVAAAS